MSDMSDFVFEKMSRIGNDECYLDQTSIQNVNTCNYTLQNYFASNCSMQKQIDLATTQPGIFYKGTYSVGSMGCNINDNSNLTIGTVQTNPKCRLDLKQRPFLTVPFLGRGSVNPVVESQMQQGEAMINKKSTNNSSEKCYIKYHHTPLLPVMKEKITNPANSLEDDASKGWIRGGIPSRELTRDSSFSA
jgi:hypothetical protein